MNSVQMSVASINFGLALPEFFLLLATSVIMIVHLFWDASKSGTRLLTAALGTLLVTALLVLRAAEPDTSGSVIAALGGQARQYGFGNLYVVDALATLLKLALLGAVALVMIYSKAYLSARKLFTGELVTLMLFATLGMMVMVSANHFVTLYLGLELLALSSYAMVALNRDSAVSTEAAMKYFVLGALASGLLLYGMSMIYGATGSLDVSVVNAIVSGSLANDPLVSFGVVFVVAGLAFKLGAVPFHMWIPDVYDGAPTPVTLFIASAPKLAAFGFVLRILAEALGGASTDWQGMLIILAVLSLAIRNVIAIWQTRIKRLLAYSTISHIGYLLLGVLAATREGYASGLFYIVTYVLTTLATFGLILLLTREGFEAEEIDDFKGLNQRSPFHALLMLFAMFSMAGIPVFVGFWAKLSVLQSVLNAGFVWLVVFAVLMSVIGAFYYLRLVKVMYFDQPRDNSPIMATGGVRVLLSLNAFAILVLGLIPGSLMNACVNAIQQSF